MVIQGLGLAEVAESGAEPQCTVERLEEKGKGRVPG